MYMYNHHYSSCIYVYSICTIAEPKSWTVPYQCCHGVPFLADAV